MCGADSSADACVRQALTPLGLGGAWHLNARAKTREQQLHASTCIMPCAQPLWCSLLGNRCKWLQGHGSQRQFKVSRW